MFPALPLAPAVWLPWLGACPAAATKASEARGDAPVSPATLTHPAGRSDAPHGERVARSGVPPSFSKESGVSPPAVPTPKDSGVLFRRFSTVFVAQNEGRFSSLCARAIKGLWIRKCPENSSLGSTYRGGAADREGSTFRAGQRSAGVDEPIRDSYPGFRA